MVCKKQRGVPLPQKKQAGGVNCLQQSAMCVNSACVVPMKARMKPALWNGDLVHVEVDGVQLIVDAASCQVGFVSCQHETTAPLLRCLQADLDAVQVHLPFWLPLVPVFLHLCPLLATRLLQLGPQSHEGRVLFELGASAQVLNQCGNEEAGNKQL